MTKTMKRNFSIIACLLICFAFIYPAIAEEAANEEIPLNPYGVRSKNPYVVRRFWENGKEIDMIIVPGRPPEVYRAPAVTPPEPNIAMGTNTLSNVPAFNWCFGCSATSAAMMAGYYDRTTYPNMYAGPTNGGVMPMDNSAWPDVVISGETRHQCPLSATRKDVDGRDIRGHVDDYWIKAGNPGPDPWIVNGWTEHTQGDCTGDFMGTNQSSFHCTDGATMFFLSTDGAPLYDYTPSDPTYRDGCHGLKLFVESRGYTVFHDGSNYQNYSQLIYPNPLYPDNTEGFTFEDFKTEIDAGRPVLIQIKGHTMLGYGYNDTGEKIFIHNTWDYSDYEMTWGGEYSGMQHYWVTVLQLTASTITFDTNPLSSGTITFDDITGYKEGDTVDKPGGTWDYDIIATPTPAIDYTFNKWEVSGGLSVADSTSDTTTCTVTGSGTLKMVVDETAGVTITFDTDPASTGTITFDGVSYNHADTISRSARNYNITGNPSSGYAFSEWEVTEDLVVGNSTSPTTACAVNDAGTLTMIQSYIGGAAGDGGGSKACFIATAAYGSYTNQHPIPSRQVGSYGAGEMIRTNRMQSDTRIHTNSWPTRSLSHFLTFPLSPDHPVAILQRFRDEYLLTNAPGRAFVSCYERISPPIAGYIKDKEPLKAVVRFYLKPLVWGARKILNLEE